MLTKPLDQVLESDELKQALSSLDINLLRKTLSSAGGVLAEHLPVFYEWLEHELGVKRVPDSPDHTTKWVVGFVNNQKSLDSLVQLHRPVPRLALETAVPRLVGLFDDVEDTRTRQEWQKAVSALCLVLVVDAREQQK